MTMDFSQLHTYTPPQCAPENTGYTYSLSSSYSTAALEFEREHQIAAVYESPRMSRRSLRLQTGAGHYVNESVADFSMNHSSSYISTRRESRSLRSKKLQSASGGVSLSLSQVATPRKALSFSAVNTPVNSSGIVQETNTASDAALLSSILEQPHLKHRSIITSTTSTTVDGHWERSFCADHSSSGVNGDTSASKSHASLPNGYICKDCSLHSQKMDSYMTHSSSSHAAEASSANALSSSSSSPFTSVYSRDKSHRSRTGLLVSMSNSCIHYSKRALAPITSLVTLLFHNVVWLGSRAKNRTGKGVLASFSDSMKRIVSSSLSQLWLLKQTTLHRMMGHRDDGYEGQAHSSFCGSMNVKDLVNEDAAHLNLNGSLCDDCKGKQHSETHTVLLTHSSRHQGLMGALWSVLVYTGYCLLKPGYCVVRAGKAMGSGARTLAQKLLALFWMLLAAPVNAGRGLLWFLATGWYQLVSLMTVLNVFFLTRCLTIIWRILLFFLPFLLLLALWLWGPSTVALLAYLPAANITEWYPAFAFNRLSSLVLASSPVTVSDHTPAPEPPVEPTPASLASLAPPMPLSVGLSGVDLERLEQMARQLTLLSERVQQDDQKQEQHHRDVLGLYSTLREQLHTKTDRESLGLWVSSLMEQRLGVLHGEIQRESTHRAESAEQQKQQQESQASRLADLELLLNAMATKTEGLQQKQQQYEHERQEKEKQTVASAADTVSASEVVKQEDHDALLVEVQRLEAELSKVKQDLLGVVGCKGKCGQLDTLQETISTQVSSQVSSQLHKELKALFFGSGSGNLPESLVHWLSQRYVSTPDLQALLASLEMNILRNVSMQLELNRAHTVGEAEYQAKTVAQTVTTTVQHTAANEGLTEEQVKLIVQNALRIYSQDRTGLVDYALESGGGSILSTRCSETYETKTALMSLFGLPLWYFSQSPRVVIQPDVFPGNCWAFKGSQGYLVIRLSMKILPTSFCVEHIPKSLSPTGNITSAPCNFTVFGLDDEYQEEGKLLGQYTYQEDGESLQTFPVMEQNDKTFQIIEVRVLSNWGHPEYTCMYRFRVHGEPQPQ